jgi:hypothetical protein
MYTLLLVLAINLAVFGSAFLLAGWLSLATPSEAEAAAQRTGYERERAKGFWHGELHSWREHRRLRGRIFSIVGSHWAERSQSRWLVYIGAGCLLAAVIIRLFIGGFS